MLAERVGRSLKGGEPRRAFFEGITYKKKGESTYVVYETGRKYDPENQYNIPERIQIGIQIPAEPDMMLPNENYLKYSLKKWKRPAGKGRI